MDGVFDASSSSPYMGRGWSAVLVGDGHLFGSRHSTPDETRNIAIRNVYSRARRAVCLTGGMTNVTLDNINGFDGCRTLVKQSAATILPR